MFFFQFQPKVALDLHKAFQQDGVEGTALAVQDHVHSLPVGVRLFVAALTGQRVVDVRQRNDLRFDGDLVPFQPVRVAAAVPPLVVPAGNAVSRLEQRLGVEVLQLAQHLRADGGVGLDDLELLLGQAAGFVQDLLVDGDLADVVQGCSQRDIILHSEVMW